MQGYPQIVRTGSHELDVQTVEQHRRAAAAQGVVLFVQPLPGGGFQLSATQAAAGDGVGATMPSNQQAAQTPIRASQNPPLARGDAQQNAALDPSGTLPSRFGAQQARISAPPQVEIIFGAGEGYCEACRRVGPLRHAHFMQNIGAVVALAVMGAVIGLVAAVILFFGIRTRVRASAGLRRLGAIR